MMTLMIAAAAAAAQPVTPAPVSPQAQHEHHMQMGKPAEQKGMDCCKDCCKEMARKHEAQGSEHAGHSNR